MLPSSLNLPVSRPLSFSKLLAVTPISSLLEPLCRPGALGALRLHLRPLLPGPLSPPTRVLMLELPSPPLGSLPSYPTLPNTRRLRRHNPTQPPRPPHLTNRRDHSNFRSPAPLARPKPVLRLRMPPSRPGPTPPRAEERVRNWEPPKPTLRLRTTLSSSASPRAEPRM